MDKELESLYNAVSAKFDTGSFDDFKSKMSTPEDRRKFYDVVSNKGLDLGDYETYEKRLGQPKGVSPETNGVSTSASGKEVSSSVSDTVSIPTQDIEPVVINKKYDGFSVVNNDQVGRVVDFGNGIQIPESDLPEQKPKQPVAKIGKKDISGVDYIAGDVDISGQAVNPEQLSKDFSDWEKQGWGTKYNVDGKDVFAPNKEGRIEIQKVYDTRVEDYNNRIAEPIKEETPLQKYSNQFYDKYGALLTDEERSQLGTQEGRDNLELQYQANNLIKNNPNLSFDEAINQVSQEMINKKNIQNPELAKSFIDQRLENMTWGMKEDTASESAWLNQQKNNPEFLKDFGAFLSSDEGKVYTSTVNKKLSTLNQKDFKDVVSAYYNYKQEQNYLDNEVNVDNYKNLQQQLLNSAKSGDTESVQNIYSELSKVRGDIQTKDQESQSLAKQQKEVNSIFSEANYWENEANKYYAKTENGENKVETVIDGASVAAVSALKKTGAGLFGILASPMALFGDKETRQAYYDINKQLGKEVEIKGSKLHDSFYSQTVVKHNGKEYIQLDKDGTVYERDKNGDLTYVENVPEGIDFSKGKKEDDWSAYGIANAVQQFGWDIYLANRLGGAITKGASSVTSTLTKNINTLEKLGQGESFVGNSLNTISKALKSPHAATNVGFFVQMYPEGVNKAHEAGIESDAGAQLYATTMAAFNAYLIGKIVPSAKMSALNSEAQGIVKQLGENKLGIAAQRTYDFLKKTAPEVAHTYGVMLGIEAGTAITDSTINKALGSDFKINQGNLLTSSAKGALPLIIFSTIAKAPALLEKNTKLYSEGKINDISKMNRDELITTLARQGEEIIPMLKQEQNNGYFQSYKDEVGKIIAEVENKKKTIDQIPEKDKYDNQTLDKLSGLLNQKESIEAEMKNANDAFKFEYKDKIDEVQKQIEETVKGKENEQTKEPTTTEARPQEDVTRPEGETTPNEAKSPKEVTYTDKEGKEYTIEQYGKTIDNGIMVVAKDGEKVIGSANFTLKKDGSISSEATTVQEPYRRKGIATAMYDYFTKQGYDIKPAPDQLEMGKKFTDKYFSDKTPINDVRELNKIDLSTDLGINKAIDVLSKIKADLDKFDRGTLGINLPVTVAKGAIDAMILASKGAKVAADIVSDGVNYVKQTDWYKNLSQEDKKEFDSKGLMDIIADMQDKIDRANNRGNKFATPKEAFERSRKDAQEAREQASNKKEPLPTKLKKVLYNVLDAYIERQSSVKASIDKAGLKGVVDYMVTKSGASAYAKDRVEEVRKKVFSKLENKDIEYLEEILQLKRTIAISKERESRGLEDIYRQGNFDRRDAELALEGYREYLGDKKFNDLDKRSNEYTKTYKDILVEMYEEGLLSKEGLDRFINVDYKPTEYIKYLEDMDGTLLASEVESAGELPLSGNQIKTNTTGSTSSELMDAEYIINKSILNRTKAVFANRVNKTFVDEFKKNKIEVDALRQKADLTPKEKKRIQDFENVEKVVKVDDVVGYTEGNNPKYALDGTNKKGYKSLYYYVDGIKNRVWLKEDFFNKFTDTNNSYLNGDVKENIALASGTSVIKTLATGNNPLFFLTNTPRDFLFTLNFSKEYGNEVLSNGIKLAVDMTKGVKDVVNNTDNYKKYLEYGGGMDYLALQGKYQGKGWTKTIVDKAISNKVQNLVTRNRVKRFLDKFNLASEAGIRLAVFNRSIKNQLEGRDIDALPKEERDLIYTKAVRSARELTDFNQGGKVTKAVDSIIPYLNAGIQGTRAAASNLIDRPLETIGRTTQIVAYTAGATVSAGMGAISLFRDDEDEKTKKMTNSDIYFDTLSKVSQYDKDNYFIIPLGFKDDKGNWKYMRVAKAQALSPLFNASEYYIRKQMAETFDNKYKDEDLGKILSRTAGKNLLPIDTNPLNTVKGIPVVSAATAWMGYDAYTGNPISWDKDKVPEQLEGRYDDRFEPMFKALGEKFDVSAPRLQKAVESFTTTPSTNPYVGISYSLGNLTTKLISDKDQEEIAPDLKKSILEPSMRRLVKSTSDYNELTSIKSRVSDEVLEAYKRKMDIEQDVKTIIRDYKDKKINDSEVNTKLLELAEGNKEYALSIRNRAKSELKNEKMNPLVSAIKFEPNKEVRAIMLVEKFGDGLKDIGSNMKGLDEGEQEVVNELLKQKALDKDTYRFYLNLVNDK